ncbi:MAG: DUF211 domain-containing protein [Candidatus Thermoplasmatota archaeon]|jgi:hypothetical protein|nr:DUF211 domain-containing protein [Candidatus Thermoplasmatota archaeon]MCL5987819.1 DUF211 domain-containing protein [Candidatus Thermoplasmatota archaeon]
MNIRRLILDVGKGLTKPTLVDLSKAISSVKGVDGVNISVTEIDIETMGLNVTIEGSNIDYEDVIKEIENSGAVVHSVDELAVGSKLIENIRREN